MSLSLQEARQYYLDELTDEELMTLVEEIDAIQCQILEEVISHAK